MKILTGKYKGKKLEMPRGIRPTQDKVRKAVFDIIRDIQGLSFLELFSGSASVGLEALSQGVKQLALVESNRECLSAIRKNIEVLGGDSVELLAMETERAIQVLAREKRIFDIIFLDPPYYQELPKKTLQTLGACDILAPNGLVIVQHYKRDPLPEKAGNLIIMRSYTYGDTILTIYKK